MPETDDYANLTAAAMFMMAHEVGIGTFTNPEEGEPAGAFPIFTFVAFMVGDGDTMVKVHLVLTPEAAEIVGNQLINQAQEVST